MCGFLGRIKEPQKRLPPLTEGLRSIGRRGPDSHQQWVSTDRAVELLHARLAIVDTDSRSHQPFTDPQSRLTVAFNGEVYNYRELRAEVSEHEFRTTSDTEVITALFARFGVAAFRKLRGMFSIALVDENSRRVYLVRDPIGKKPLFMADWLQGCFFGSSVLALCAISGQTSDVNQDAAQEFWEDGHVGANNAILHGCKPVATGCVVELDFDGRVRSLHSCIPEPDLVAHNDLTTNKKIITDLLQQAVQRRLVNNPNPVTLLSGGIDSTVVTAEVKRHCEPSSITLGSVITGRNDEKYAHLAAKRLSIPLQVVRAKSKSLSDDVAWAMHLQDEPLGMISYFPLALMIRAAKDYGRILITGDGGDEVFLGYGNAEDWIAKDNQRIADSTCPSWMSEWGCRTITRALVGHMFTKLDRAAAEQGVETRSPLLDWDLVAFVRQLGPDQMFFDGRVKALLKSQLEGWPQTFIDRPKVGFAYNLRWAWLPTRFAGLRELVSREAVARFESELPLELRAAPGRWSTKSIFQNFPTVWKLIAWSTFCERLHLSARPTTPVAADSMELATTAV